MFLRRSFPGDGWSLGKVNRWYRSRHGESPASRGAACFDDPTIWMARYRRGYWGVRPHVPGAPADRGSIAIDRDRDRSIRPQPYRRIPGVAYRSCELTGKKSCRNRRSGRWPPQETSAQARQQLSQHSATGAKQSRVRVSVGPKRFGGERLKWIANLFCFRHGTCAGTSYWLGARRFAN